MSKPLAPPSTGKTSENRRAATGVGDSLGSTMAWISESRRVKTCPSGATERLKSSSPLAKVCTGRNFIPLIHPLLPIASPARENKKSGQADQSRQAREPADAGPTATTPTASPGLLQP